MRIVTVSNANPADFLPFEPVPRCRRDDSDDAADEPQSPHLSVRVTPSGERATLSSLSLIELLDITQRLLDFSADEVAHGVRPALADRRVVDWKLRQLARLQVEPMADEEFTLAGSLADHTVRVRGGVSVGPDEVLGRFMAVLSSAGDAGLATCAGMLQALEELGGILRREASRVEFEVTTPSGPARRVVIDHAYVNRVIERRSAGAATRTADGSLRGVLTSLDLARETLKLRTEDGAVVSGAFSPFLREQVVRLLGRTVSVSGSVTYQGSQPVFVAAQEIDGEPGA